MDCAEQQRQSGLQTWKAGRRVGTVFLLQGVRGVVAGKAIDHLQVLPQSSLVGGRCQGRLYLLRPGPRRGISAWLRNKWCGVTSQVTGRPSLLRYADEQDFFPQGNMRQVQGLL